MLTSGKLKLTDEINKFPAEVQTVENGSKQFDIDPKEQIVTVSFKPKMFKKLEQAQKNYPTWASAIALTDEGKDRFGFSPQTKRASFPEKTKRTERKGSNCCECC